MPQEATSLYSHIAKTTEDLLRELKQAFTLLLKDEKQRELFATLCDDIVRAGNPFTHDVAYLGQEH